MSESFVCSPMKSVRKASLELAIPLTSVQRALRKSLQLCPYHLQLANFAKKCCYMKMTILLIVSSSVMNLHFTKVDVLCIWGSENPNVVVPFQRDSPKLNVFCAISWQKVYGPLFFGEATVTDDEPENFIWQQDGAPPHWHNLVYNCLNIVELNRWIGRQGLDDRICLHVLPI
ncbi:hypothetical protein J437_LFUL016827 [Ladona fulva]|uniref:Uncharacterized protein n=1 Tax=Ladona fulva TaxID=123851 RepID=A0A8K0KPH1_LADFU|nr:hypothetical protein J437_LFUL016827 [Ladona fulva]